MLATMGFYLLYILISVSVLRTPKVVKISFFTFLEHFCQILMQNKKKNSVKKCDFWVYSKALVTQKHRSN